MFRAGFGPGGSGPPGVLIGFAPAAHSFAAASAIAFPACHAAFAARRRPLLACSDITARIHCRTVASSSRTSPDFATAPPATRPRSDATVTPAPLARPPARPPRRLLPGLIGQAAGIMFRQFRAGQAFIAGPTAGSSRWRNRFRRWGFAVTADYWGYRATRLRAFRLSAGSRLMPGRAIGRVQPMIWLHFPPPASRLFARRCPRWPGFAGYCQILLLHHHRTIATVARSSRFLRISAATVRACIRCRWFSLFGPGAALGQQPGLGGAAYRCRSSGQHLLGRAGLFSG